MTIEEVENSAKLCSKLGRDWYEIEKGQFDWLISEINELKSRFNEQAICAETFTTTMAENVLLRKALDSIISDGVQGTEFVSTSQILHSCIETASKAISATPKTSKVQDVLNAAAHIASEEYLAALALYSHIGVTADKTNGIAALVNAVKAMEE